jgi:hypothetical protein
MRLRTFVTPRRDTRATHTVSRSASPGHTSQPPPVSGHGDRPPQASNIQAIERTLRIQGRLSWPFGRLIKVLDGIGQSLAPTVHLSCREIGWPNSPGRPPAAYKGWSAQIAPRSSFPASGAGLAAPGLGFRQGPRGCRPDPSCPRLELDGRDRAHACVGVGVSVRPRACLELGSGRLRVGSELRDAGKRGRAAASGSAGCAVRELELALVSRWSTWTQ